MSESLTKELTRRLSGYPAEARSFFRDDLYVAARLSDEVRRKVVQELVINLRRGRRRIAGSTLRSLTGLPANESEQLMSAYSLIVGLLAESSATPDDFIRAARNIIFSEGDDDSIRAIVAQICDDRAVIAAALQRAQIAGAVLPSFRRMEISIDIRVRFSEGRADAHIPVAIMRIDTDADNQQLWFQMTEGDIEDAIEKLQGALEQIRISDSLILRQQ